MPTSTEKVTTNASCPRVMGCYDAIRPISIATTNTKMIATHH